MNDQSETARVRTSASGKLLEVSDRRIAVSMMLDGEIDQLPFHVFADGDYAVISFDSLSDAMALLKRYKAIANSNNEQIILFRRMLAKIGLTICCQNRHFGFIGPNANSILSKLFTFATSIRRKGKASLLQR